MMYFSDLDKNTLKAYNINEKIVERRKPMKRKNCLLKLSDVHQYIKKNVKKYEIFFMEFEYGIWWGYILPLVTKWKYNYDLHLVISDPVINRFEKMAFAGKFNNDN